MAGELRKAIIRLAYTKPEHRAALLPLLRQAASKLDLSDAKRWEAQLGKEIGLSNHKKKVRDAAKDAIFGTLKGYDLTKPAEVKKAVAELRGFADRLTGGDDEDETREDEMSENDREDLQAACNSAADAVESASK